MGVMRSLLGERFDVGLNLMLANGYTGQTTETLALPDETMPFERVVGYGWHPTLEFPFPITFNQSRSEGIAAPEAWGRCEVGDSAARP